MPIASPETYRAMLDAAKAGNFAYPAINVTSSETLNAALKGFATATDLADYLVRKGTPFRDAHEVVGKSVAYCVDKGCDLADLQLAELRRFSDSIDADVFDHLTLEGSVAARDHTGGTAPVRVRSAIADAHDRAIVEYFLQQFEQHYDAVKHLVLCRIERRPPRLDLDIYAYLPRARVETTKPASYMSLMSRAAP